MIGKVTLLDDGRVGIVLKCLGKGGSFMYYLVLVGMEKKIMFQGRSAGKLMESSATLTQLTGWHEWK
jgi:hypothetical protein